MTEAQAAANKLLVLLSYERQLRDRNSQMEAPGADFRSIFKLIEQADARQAAKQQQVQAQVCRRPQSVAGSSSQSSTRMLTDVMCSRALLPSDLQTGTAGEPSEHCRYCLLPCHSSVVHMSSQNAFLQGGARLSQATQSRCGCWSRAQHAPALLQQRPVPGPAAAVRPARVDA